MTPRNAEGPGKHHQPEAHQTPVPADSQDDTKVVRQGCAPCRYGRPEPAGSLYRCKPITAADRRRQAEERRRRRAQLQALAAWEAGR
jgi:hypothetical protein